MLACEVSLWIREFTVGYVNSHTHLCKGKGTRTVAYRENVSQARRSTAAASVIACFFIISLLMNETVEGILTISLVVEEGVDGRASMADETGKQVEFAWGWLRFPDWVASNRNREHSTT